MRAEGLYGTSEQESPEAGVGVSLYSEELAWWMTLGDPALDGGHRLKELWLESRYRGPVMGTMPLGMALAMDDDEPVPGPVVLPFRTWRLGLDRTTHRAAEWDWSAAWAMNVPGFLGVDPRRFLLGPTLGLGLNLTWWDAWKTVTDRVTNTGKVTAEAGFVAGFDVRDTLYAQQRSTLHYDLFGAHQHNLNVAAVAGLWLGRWKVPVGMEVSGELDLGDDTWNAESGLTWSARGALYWRLVPGEPDEDMERLLEAMQSLSDPQVPLPLPAPEDPVPEDPVPEDPVPEDPVPEDPLPTAAPVEPTSVPADPAPGEFAVPAPGAVPPADPQAVQAVPAPGEPAVEEPAVEEPAVEEPVVEEPSEDPNRPRKKTRRIRGPEP